jgi:hypothetical protein
LTLNYGISFDKINSRRRDRITKIITQYSNKITSRSIRVFKLQVPPEQSASLVQDFLTSLSQKPPIGLILVIIGAPTQVQE